MTKMPKRTKIKSATRRSAKISAKPKIREFKSAAEYDKFFVRKGKAVRALAAQSRAEVRHAVAEVCQFALKLSKDEKLWTDFTRLVFWQKVKGARPRVGHQGQAVRFALRRFCGTTDKASKQASLYWRAVGPLLESGIAAEALSAVVKRAGGFKKLAAHNTTKVKGAAKAAGKGTENTKCTTTVEVEVTLVFADQASAFTSLTTPCDVLIRGRIDKMIAHPKLVVTSVQRTDDTNDLASESVELGFEHSVDGPAHKINKPRHVPDYDLATTLFIEISEKLITDVLGRDEEEMARLNIKCVGIDDVGWKTIRAVGVVERIASSWLPAHLEESAETDAGAEEGDKVQRVPSVADSLSGFDPKQTLVVTCPPLLLQLVLNLEKGQRGYLKIECTDQDERGWKVFSARAFKREAND